jgi:putative Mg2+ transporter-C (MgtC) family protein
LTSAATVFAVAAVGMACGAGLYLPAVFAALLILLTLEAVGALETLTNLKLQSRIYEIRGSDADALHLAVLAAMDAEQRRLESVDRDDLGGMTRLSFTVMATRRGHRQLTALLMKASGIEHVLTFRSWEDE